jgi:hypothetical protein
LPLINLQQISHCRSSPFTPLNDPSKLIRLGRVTDAVPRLLRPLKCGSVADKLGG